MRAFSFAAYPDLTATLLPGYPKRSIFMLTLGNAESRRACVLIDALDEHEITFKEFEAGISGLTPEALWVVATTMAAEWDSYPERAHKLYKARHMCRVLAESHRNLN